jgi:hypothetical protein
MFALDLLHWQAGVISAAGILSALAVGLAGRALVLQQRVDPAPPEPPPGAEGPGQRRSRRRGDKLAAVLVSDESAKTSPFIALLLDRSGGGLGLELPWEVPVGTVVSLRAPHAPDTVPWVQATVKHRRRVGRRRWVAGCAFVDEPPGDVLRLFG